MNSTVCGFIDFEFFKIAIGQELFLSVLEFDDGRSASLRRLAARSESHFTDGHLRLHAPGGDAEIAGLARPLYGQAIMAAASQLRSRPAVLLREPPIQARP